MRGSDGMLIPFLNVRYGFFLSTIRTARSATLVAALFAIYGAHVAPVSAQAVSELSLHTGTEVQNNLRWHLISYNRFLPTLGANNPLPPMVHRLIAHDRVRAGVSLNLSQARTKEFDRSRHDVSVIPSLGYAFNRSVYISAGVGVAFNDLDDEESLHVSLRLGGKWFFAPAVKLGVVLTRQSRPLLLEFSYGHRSNGGLADPNAGLDLFTIGLGVRF